MYSLDVGQGKDLVVSAVSLVVRRGATALLIGIFHERDFQLLQSSTVFLLNQLELKV